MADNRVEVIINDICAELLKATNKLDVFTTTHHGYAVILEELDELWACIKTKGTSTEEMRLEAIQVAAMAMRFILDCIDEAKEPVCETCEGEGRVPCIVAHHTLQAGVGSKPCPTCDGGKEKE